MLISWYQGEWEVVQARKICAKLCVFEEYGVERSKGNAETVILCVYA